MATMKEIQQLQAKLRMAKKELHQQMKAMVNRTIVDCLELAGMENDLIRPREKNEIEKITIDAVESIEKILNTYDFIN